MTMLEVSARGGERAIEAGRGGSERRQADPEGSRRGKILSPGRRRQPVQYVKSSLGYSERRVRRALGVSRWAVRYAAATAR